MKDGMQNLFRARFEGHESPVDPGIWDGIQQQMAMSAPATDGVQDLFKERFQGHETAVDPSVWQGISSQLGHGVAASSTVGSMSWAAAGAAVVAIGVLGYFIMKEPSTEVALQPVVELITPSITTTKDAALPEQKAEVPVASGLLADKPTADVAVKAIPVMQKDAPRVDRIPAERTTASSSVPTNSNTGQKPGDPGSLPPAIANTTSVDPTPKSATNRADAPEKVESIIRKLTDEVQMEVLANPAQVVVDEAATTPEDDLLGDMIAADRSMAPMPKLFMPNTFTPNGDGVNDTYTLVREGYRSMMVRVYSMKSNQLVFSTNNGEAWTGDTCEDGMYMVAVEAVTDDGRTMTEGKVVWLTRVRLN